MAHVLILNGPNLNMLGRREPAVYGNITLAEIGDLCAAHAAALGLSVGFEQTNSEGDMVSLIHKACDSADGIVINAGAYTHSSIAILDALKIFEGPIVELHMSNIHGREDFRQQSYVALAASGSICGFGAKGYLLALTAIADLLDS